MKNIFNISLLTTEGTTTLTLGGGEGGSPFVWNDL